MLNDKGEYSNSIDIWAIGVSLYNMLAGKQPFADNDFEGTIVKILHDPVNFSHDVFASIDGRIKKLIEGILNKDPKTRLSPGEIKMIPWIAEKIGSDELDTFKKDFIPRNTIKNIQKLLKMKLNMKPVFLAFCVQNLHGIICEELMNEFKLSNNEDQFSQELLSFKELITRIVEKAEKHSLDNVSNMFKDFLTENESDCTTQKINVYNFMVKIHNSGDLIYKEKLWNLFKNLDSNNNDYIEINSLKSIKRFSSINTEQKAKDLIKNKKSIDFKLFSQLCKEIKFSFEKIEES
mmetsp:Transcript_5683/g.5857  ORF Transcript_5683/g.5857 Transcript_5683/m.5857 type:complete len:292 (-) Transcript_5683:29-904(-)